MLLFNEDIKESATLKINSIANKKKKSGEKVYNFSVGEPIVDNDAFVVQETIEALKTKRAGYPPSTGLGELLDLSASWMNENYDCHYDSKEAMITCGGKYGIFLALQALLDAGDEVIVISPYWVSYPEMVKIFGGVAKICKTKADDDWKIDTSELNKLISLKTKAIIINNASNPTGHLFSREELEGVLRLAHEKGIFIISDEVYSGLVYDDNQFISSGEFSEFKDKLIIIQSCSKNFAMTGWRVGIIFGPVEVIKCLSVLQSQSITNTSIVSQWAAIGAFRHAAEITSKIKDTIQARRDCFVKVFNELFPGKIIAPRSALYCFVSLADLGVSEKSADELSVELIEKANIALTPGGSFGEDGYVRFSFGVGEDEIKEGLAALKKYLSLS